MARRPSSLASLSIAQIQRELERRQKELPALQKQRAKLLSSLEKLDSRIAGLGGSTPTKTARAGRSGPRKRPKNSMTLVEALEKVLKGKQMSIGQAISAVKAAGYKTNSKSFRISVNATLLKYTDKFKKVARGLYTAK